MEQQNLQIRDLGLAAAIVSLGFEVLETRRDMNSRIYFVFVDSPELQEAIKEYWANTLNVKARYYFDAIKMLKTRIYSER